MIIRHNHSSTGYCGILYLDFTSNSPHELHQPWNDENDLTKLYKPQVDDIMMCHNFYALHRTKQNLLKKEFYLLIFY